MQERKICGKFCGCNSYTTLRIKSGLSRLKALYSYEEELQKSPESQEKFVKFLPRLFHRAIEDRSFQSHFNTLVEEEVSLFNTHYLKKFCTIFPKDVW